MLCSKSFHLDLSVETSRATQFPFLLHPLMLRKYLTSLHRFGYCFSKALNEYLSLHVSLDNFLKKIYELNVETKIRLS